ncbi:MAG TPA: AtpZ/AtpI family protein [Candidatus Limnocylindria bacterium]
MAVPVTKPDPSVDDESTRPERNTAAGIGMALDLGVRLGVSVVIGLGAGLLLDNWLHTSPIFTLIGMVVGIAAAMYTIWDVARDAMRK